MITVESTNNPNVVKFVLNRSLFEGSREYKDIGETADFPLAGTLLQFPFVESVLTMDNFIAILKNDLVSWQDVEEELVNLIESEMQNQLPSQKKAVEVYVESTPNPNTIKLLTNLPLYKGVAEANRMTGSENFPLAEYLLQNEYIEEVFVSDSIISISKTEDADWADHTFEIRDIVANYLRDNKEIVSEKYIGTINESIAVDPKEFSEFEKEIQKVLEEYVKPAVAADGGNIDLLEYDESSKTAQMLLQGACSGCPSSSLTLKNGIEAILKQYFPDKIESVVAING